MIAVEARSAASPCEISSVSVVPPAIEADDAGGGLIVTDAVAALIVWL